MQGLAGRGIAPPITHAYQRLLPAWKMRAGRSTVACKPRAGASCLTFLEAAPGGNTRPARAALLICIMGCGWDSPLNWNTPQCQIWICAHTRASSEACGAAADPRLAGRWVAAAGASRLCLVHLSLTGRSGSHDWQCRSRWSQNHKIQMVSESHGVQSLSAAARQGRAGKPTSVVETPVLGAMLSSPSEPWLAAERGRASVNPAALAMLGVRLGLFCSPAHHKAGHAETCLQPSRQGLHHAQGSGTHGDQLQGRRELNPKVLLRCRRRVHAEAGGAAAPYWLKARQAPRLGLLCHSPIECLSVQIKTSLSGSAHQAGPVGQTAPRHPGPCMLWGIDANGGAIPRCLLMALLLAGTEAGSGLRPRVGALCVRVSISHSGCTAPNCHRQLSSLSMRLVHGYRLSSCTA